MISNMSREFFFEMRETDMVLYTEAILSTDRVKSR